MPRNEKTAQYGLVNPDSGDVRVSDDKGDAKLVNGSGGEKEFGFTDWKPWLYTAGGGVLAYLLAKKLLGDDDEEDGKKKGFLGTILPYLAAIGGGLGGNYLSGIGNDPGQKGEIAFAIGPDGSVKMPDKPLGGWKYLEGGGYGLGGAGAAAAGTKAWLNYQGSKLDKAYASAREHLNLPENYSVNKIKNLYQNVEGGKTINVPQRSGSTIDIKKSNPNWKAFKNSVDSAAKIVSARKNRWGWAEGLRNKIVGKGRYGGKGMWGLLAGTLASLGAGYFGDKMNDDYQAYLKVMKALGKDVND